MGIWDALKTVFGGRQAAPGSVSVAPPTPEDAAEDADEGDAEGGFVPEAKAPTLVVRRLIQVVLMAEIADTMFAGKHPEARKLQPAILDRLVALGFTPKDLEAAEQRLVFGLRSGQVEKGVALGASWRLECAHVLAWALGLRSDIGAPSDLPSLRAELPADAAALEETCRAATVRPLPELLAARNAWSLRTFPLASQAPSDERSQVLERMRALRWLTEPDQHELSAISVL